VIPWRVRIGVALVLGLAASGGPGRSAERPALPPFLPSYYAPVLELKDVVLQFVESGEKNGMTRYAYAVPDRGIFLSVESLACDRPRCETVFNNTTHFFNTEISKSGGRFHALTSSELDAAWRVGKSDIRAVVFVLPTSLQFWTWSAPRGAKVGIDAKPATLDRLRDRQRYEEALRAGNVEMGHWAPAVHRHARWLQKQGRKADALVALRHTITAAPFNFEAHLDLAELEGDRAAAVSSAGVVFDNAERPEFTARAAKLLGRQEPTAAGLPPLQRSDGRLQVVLIALPPVDVRLVEQAARIYEQIAAVPMRLVRLDSVWEWAARAASPSSDESSARSSSTAARTPISPAGPATTISANCARPCSARMQQLAS
jgi:hypothetical protein